MVTAREFLYTKFPTKEDRKKVKTLSVYSYYDTNPNPTDDENYYFDDTWLTGELDLTDFVNLEVLDIKDQSQVSLKSWEQIEKLVDFEVSDNLFPSFPHLNYKSFTKSNFELDRVKKEKQELQQDLFSLQEKIRLDSKEIERLSEKNEELEQENQALKEQLEELQTKEANEEKKISFKKNKLQKIKSNLEGKLTDDFQKNTLETLLISQEQITRLQGSSSQIISLSEKQFNKSREKLRAVLSEEEIEKICQIQIELTQLEIELEKIETGKIESK